MSYGALDALVFGLALAVDAVWVLTVYWTSKGYPMRAAVSSAVLSYVSGQTTILYVARPHALPLVSLASALATFTTVFLHARAR